VVLRGHSRRVTFMYDKVQQALTLRGPATELESWLLLAPGYSPSGDSDVLNSLEFNQIVPLPATYKTEPYFYTGYFMTVQEWGVPKGALSVQGPFREDGQITYTFMTQTGIPHTWYRKASKRFPLLDFYISFGIDEGIAGCFHFRGGELIDSDLPVFSAEDYPKERDFVGEDGKLDDIAFEEAWQKTAYRYVNNHNDWVREMTKENVLQAVLKGNSGLQYLAETLVYLANTGVLSREDARSHLDSIVGAELMISASAQYMGALVHVLEEATSTYGEELEEWTSEEVGKHLPDAEYRSNYIARYLFDNEPIAFDKAKYPVQVPELVPNPDSRNDLSFEERVNGALSVAFSYGGTDGSHHKMWVIDQMVRVLTGENYNDWVRKRKEGEDGPDTYEWDEGIAP